MAHPPIDLALVRQVATESNRAHQRMGTELLGVDDERVTIALAWRDDLTDASGGLAPGVVASLLDHACALSALVALRDPARFGTTLGLRVDYLQPPQAYLGAIACGEALPERSGVLTVRGWAFHPDDPAILIATSIGTVATAR